MEAMAGAGTGAFNSILDLQYIAQVWFYEYALTFNSILDLPVVTILHSIVVWDFQFYPRFTHSA